MARPETRKAELLLYLYERRQAFSAGELMKSLKMPKQTVYQILNELTGNGYFEISINHVDRIRRYSLKEKYLLWYDKAKELGIPLEFELKGGLVRQPTRGGTSKAREQIESDVLTSAAAASPSTDEIEEEARKIDRKRKKSGA